MKLHHVGYLVTNINKSINAFTLLETNIIVKEFIDNNRKAVFALLKTEGNLIELIQPMDDSSLNGLKNRYVNAPYHLCFCSREIEKQFDILREQGFFPMEEITPSALFEGKKVCFLFSKEIGIIELIEE